MLPVCFPFATSLLPLKAAIIPFKHRNSSRQSSFRDTYSIYIYINPRPDLGYWFVVKRGQPGGMEKGKEKRE
jgi:hypothetical protein